MASVDSSAVSALDRRKMTLARNLLVPPPVRSRGIWPVIGAAAFAAFTALALATATILVPPVVSEHVAVKPNPRGR